MAYNYCVYLLDLFRIVMNFADAAYFADSGWMFLANHASIPLPVMHLISEISLSCF